ncbi:MAG: hypothetical protein MUE46_17115 [Xanthomonadales bacterium]|jgi:hypothetical protein|nr:hypothetical protein [Xanthomonadales bacterium]
MKTITRIGMFATLFFAVGFAQAQTQDESLRFQSSDLIRPSRGVCELIQSTAARSSDQSTAKAALLSDACVNAPARSDAVLAAGVSEGHIGAILRVLASGSKSVSVKIDDVDLLRALEEAAHSSDPYTLYVLSGYANSAHAEALQFRTGTSLWLGQPASTAWLFAACESGLDCTSEGLLFATNCALSGFCMTPDLEKPVGFDAGAVREMLDSIRSQRAARGAFFDNMKSGS